jgi:hypothetical protein
MIEALSSRAPFHGGVILDEATLWAHSATKPKIHCHIPAKREPTYERLTRKANVPFLAAKYARRWDII